MTDGRALIDSLGFSTVAFGAAPLGDEYGSVDVDEMQATISAALDAGVTTFDTSPYYGRTLSESRLGRALRGRRDEALLITKAGRYDRELPHGFDFSAERLRRSIDESLQRLGTDHVDLLLLHDIEFSEPAVIMDEAIPTLSEIKAAGKTRAVGASSYRLDVLGSVVAGGGLDAVLTFCHTDLIDSSAITDLSPVADEHDVALLAASPLHMGLLTPSGGPGWHPALPQARRRASDIRSAAVELGADVVGAALGYALRLDGLASTVVGVSNRAELRKLVTAQHGPAASGLIAGLLERVGPPGVPSWPSGIWPSAT